MFFTTVSYPIKGTPFYNEVESKIITNLPWENRTDRDLDFAGRYSKKFYKHANRYVVNEVNYHKLKKSGASAAQKYKTFVKAKISQFMMKITK